MTLSPSSKPVSIRSGSLGNYLFGFFSKDLLPRLVSPQGSPSRPLQWFPGSASTGLSVRDRRSQLKRDICGDRRGHVAA